MFPGQQELLFHIYPLDLFIKKFLQIAARHGLCCGMRFSSEHINGISPGISLPLPALIPLMLTDDVLDGVELTRQRVEVELVRGAADVRQLYARTQKRQSQKRKRDRRKREQQFILVLSRIQRMRIHFRTLSYQFYHTVHISHKMSK